MMQVAETPKIINAFQSFWQELEQTITLSSLLLTNFYKSKNHSIYKNQYHHYLVNNKTILFYTCFKALGRSGCGA